MRDVRLSTAKDERIARELEAERERERIERGEGGPTSEGQVIVDGFEGAGRDGYGYGRQGA